MRKHKFRNGDRPFALTRLCSRLEKEELSKYLPPFLLHLLSRVIGMVLNGLVYQNRIGMRTRIPALPTGATVRRALDNSTIQQGAASIDLNGIVSSRSHRFSLIVFRVVGS